MPLVTSPNPSCRRGTITTQGRAHILFSPYRGSQRGSQEGGDYHARACKASVKGLRLKAASPKALDRSP